MASTIIEPVADALKSLIEGLGITSYRWAPHMMDALPVAVIDIPAVQRTALGGAETEMGRDDWLLTFPVAFYFDLSDAMTTQRAAVEVFEAFVAAVDADPDLSSLVDEARVTSGEPVLDLTRDRRPLYVIECSVETLALVV